MEQNKNLEYYLDSRIYSKEEVQKSIEETKKEFPNKQMEVSVVLNEFGVYTITFQFQNKNNYFHKIKMKFCNQFQKKSFLNQENKMKANYGEKRYGQYKETKTYRPY